MGHVQQSKKLSLSIRNLRYFLSVEGNTWTFEKFKINIELNNSWMITENDLKKKILVSAGDNENLRS